MVLTEEALHTKVENDCPGVLTPLKDCWLIIDNL